MRVIKQINPKILDPKNFEKKKFVKNFKSIIGIQEVISFKFKKYIP